MHSLIRSLVLLCAVASPLTAFAQIRVQRIAPDTGTVLAVTHGSINLKDSKGQERSFKIQVGEDDPLVLSGRPLHFPATISVRGDLRVDVLREGALLAFAAKIAKGGRVTEPIAHLDWKADDPVAPVIKPGKTQETKPRIQECQVIGNLHAMREDRLTVGVPRSPQAPRGKLTVRLSPTARVHVDSNSLALVRPGDTVDEFRAVRFSTGDFGIQSLRITLTDASSERTSSRNDALSAKYAGKSNEPTTPREVRSQHFVLQTDISDRQAAILLDKLETMLTLVSRYYGRPPQGVIRCCVVRDIKQWPLHQLDPASLAKINNSEGVTINRSLGRQRSSIVYSCDKHQVVQHEAVHAYCHQTFGSTGPTWYSEGMAEMGAYWREGDRQVALDTPVIDYLTRAEPKRLLEIVATGQITGDSWQAYAWRWALCHLLANNPNYERRFKGLGIAMMSGEPASFESTFGDLAEEISFEYDQFIENFGNGYRADLCAWQWKPAKTLTGNRKVKRTIRAAAGWQPTQIRLETGATYQFATKGEWKINPASESLTADGGKNGRGRLVAAVLTDDYRLTDAITLEKRGMFKAPVEGQLYLRCLDDWNQIGDNDGALEVYLRLAQD